MLLLKIISVLILTVGAVMNFTAKFIVKNENNEYTEEEYTKKVVGIKNISFVIVSVGVIGILYAWRN